MRFPEFREIKKKEFKGDWHSEPWKILVEYLHLLKSGKELDRYLRLLLTGSDRKRVLKHALIAARLEEGKGYMEIRNEFGVTHQTISAVKSAMEDGTYRTYNDKFAKTREANLLRKQRYLDRKAEKPVPKRYRRTKYGKISY